ncbi:MAG: orotate phosphoribosyltransferase [Clostridiales bacterium]|nr:orotate phosphoribosyltransferase [Clostridiales bacterium]
MENRKQEIRAVKDKHVKIDIMPGHFATNHSHVNYCVDMTQIKTQHKMAKRSAKILADMFSSTHIDTIVCLEGTEILGAFLADTLSENGINSGTDIFILTPELNANNQMIFRDNTQCYIWGKQVLLLISSVSTGKTINRLSECIQYYTGHLTGIGSIFSAVSKVNGTPINSIFTTVELPGYTTYYTSECPMCKSGQKVDALVNSYGYSKI